MSETTLGQKCASCPQMIDKRRAGALCNECQKAKARERRKARDEAMRSLGLVKVRGALGGTYWE